MGGGDEIWKMVKSDNEPNQMFHNTRIKSWERVLVNTFQKHADYINAFH